MTISTARRLALVNGYAAARRAGNFAELAVLGRELVAAGFLSIAEARDDGIDIHAIAAAPAVRASFAVSRHSRAEDSPMSNIERLELERLRNYARSRAEDDPKKKPTLDDVKALLRQCIDDADEDPQERQRARKMLKLLEDADLTEDQARALASMRMGDPFAEMVDRQRLSIRGVRS